MAKRTSGNMTVRVEWVAVGAFQYYRARVSADGRHLATHKISEPVCGMTDDSGKRIAVDHPEAYDATARAAIAFTLAQGKEGHPDYDPNGLIGRIAVRRK